MSETLLVDMDGVICDTMGSALDIASSESGIQLCHADIRDYWFKGMPIEPGVIVEILRRPGFYATLDVITGAVRRVNRLREKYDVRVCSTPMSGVEASCEADKRQWLEEVFDNEFAVSAIISKDKSGVDGKVMIEDNPDIDRNAIWTPVMFSQPWNMHVTDLERMYGWGALDVVDGMMEQ